jgi:hypothetical protein
MDFVIPPKLVVAFAATAVPSPLEKLPIIKEQAHGNLKRLSL